MKKLLIAVGLLIVAGAGGDVLAQQADAPPYWAYGYTGPPPPPGSPRVPGVQTGPRDAVTLHTIAGSSGSFTEVQANASYGPADWFPDEHPAMPDIVAHGRQDARILACALCHLPSGMGRPENANVTGLTPEYFMQQLMDFKSGKRVTSDPRKTNTANMVSYAKAMTDDEMKQVTAYFTAVKPQKTWIAVRESATVPKTQPIGGIFFALTGAAAGTEPIGNRIIETPINGDETDKFRNPHSGFIAYVPPGSVAKGKTLAESGGGRFTACVVCHGSDLRGLGPAPTLAGRSPSYIVRQLYDMQQGNRTGAWTPLMVQVVAAMTPQDMLNVAAYATSLPQ